MEHNGPGLEYKVSYRRQDVEEDWREHMVKRHSFVVKNTPTFVPYEIKIQARNHQGWGPEPRVVSGYSGEDCESAAQQCGTITKNRNDEKYTFIVLVCRKTGGWNCISKATPATESQPPSYIKTIWTVLIEAFSAKYREQILLEGVPTCTDRGPECSSAQSPEDV